VIARGDIRWFRFASPDKRRPVLVLGLPEALPSLSQIPVVPISTQIRGLPWEVPLGPEDGLPSHCVLKPEWIRIVERAHLGQLIAQYPSNDCLLSARRSSMCWGSAARRCQGGHCSPGPWHERGIARLRTQGAAHRAPRTVRGARRSVLGERRSVLGARRSANGARRTALGARRSVHGVGCP